MHFAQGDQRREAILAFIRQYWAEYKIAPTVQEITDGIGVSSKTGVRHHLSIMVDAGLITIQPGKYRSIRPTEPLTPAA